MSLMYELTQRLLTMSSSGALTPAQSQIDSLVVSCIRCSNTCCHDAGRLISFIFAVSVKDLVHILIAGACANRSTPTRQVQKRFGRVRDDCVAIRHRPSYQTTVLMILVPAAEPCPAYFRHGNANTLKISSRPSVFDQHQLVSATGR